MGAAIGDILGLAAGVAVSPLPIVAMILVLATPRGRANGSLFGVGWLAGLSHPRRRGPAAGRARRRRRTTASRPPGPAG